MAPSKTPRCSPRYYISPRSSSSHVSFDHVFFPNDVLPNPPFERRYKPSFIRSGSLLGSRPLARMQARAGKLVSSFRVRRGRKREKFANPVDDSSKVGDNSIQSKSLSYLPFRRIFRVISIRSLRASTFSRGQSRCETSVRDRVSLVDLYNRELILSKERERDETRFSQRRKRSRRRWSVIFRDTREMRRVLGGRHAL